MFSDYWISASQRHDVQSSARLPRCRTSAWVIIGLDVSASEGGVLVGLPVEKVTLSRHEEEALLPDSGAVKATSSTWPRKAKAR